MKNTLHTPENPVWSYLHTGETPTATYDVLGNRPQLKFSEKLFWETCKILSLKNAQLKAVWKAQLIGVSKVEEMVLLIGEQMREHFIKVYAALAHQEMGAAEA